MLGDLLQLSQDGNSVFAVAGAVLGEEQPLTKSAVYQWFTQKKVDSFFYYEENIARFIAQQNQTDQTAVVTKEKNDQENKNPDPENTQKAVQEPLILAERRNASVAVSFDENEMAAYLTVTGPYGGAALKGSDLLLALSNALIMRGINKNMLRKLFEHALKLKRGQRVKAQIAIGQAPVAGENAQLRYLVQDARERILRPQMRDDGTVDMRDLGKLIMVEEGQLLATYQPATPGVNGYTVTG
ncbi:MAG: flagellar assembly protein A, partial [Vibrionaceae bacterium]